jgi:DNA-binding CsgD family transcriptional regulator
MIPPPTPREKDILTHLAQGATNEQIAKRLSISPNTVKNHKANLIEKLGLRTCHELTIYAFKWRSEQFPPPGSN